MTESHMDFDESKHNELIEALDEIRQEITSLNRNIEGINLTLRKLVERM